jgi:hypothetical protein
MESRTRHARVDGVHVRDVTDPAAQRGWTAFAVITAQHADLAAQQLAETVDERERGFAMYRENSKQCHHGHHPQDELHTERPALSRSDRLIIRLQHTIRHNHDHATTYRSMAEEAQEIGALEAARWIRGAAEQSARQTEDLEKALTALKNP